MVEQDNEKYVENIFGDTVESESTFRTAETEVTDDLTSRVDNLEGEVDTLQLSSGNSGILYYEKEQNNDFVLGDIVSMGRGGVFYKSVATVEDSYPEAAEAVGMVIAATGEKFLYITSGYIDFDSQEAISIRQSFASDYRRAEIKDDNGQDLASGTIYYLSPVSDTAGKMTVLKPISEGSVIKPVFIAKGPASGVFVNYRGIEVEYLVKDEDDMSSDSDVHMATQQSIKAYVDDGVQEAKDYTDSELTDYASDTVTFTNKTIDADNNTISNLEHGSEVDAPSAGTGVTYGHIDDQAQTIYGAKTFDSFPVTPSSAPTSNYEAANKKYVDDNSSTSYWSRTGTKLSTDTADDDVEVEGTLFFDSDEYQYIKGETW